MPGFKPPFAPVCTQLPIDDEQNQKTGPFSGYTVTDQRIAFWGRGRFKLYVQAKTSSTSNKFYIKFSIQTLAGVVLAESGDISVTSTTFHIKSHEFPDWFEGGGRQVLLYVKDKEGSGQTLTTKEMRLEQQD
jgi:hypothetical protein